jgi:hypothetical protein
VKYVVQLNDERKAVTLDSDGVRYEADPAVHAELSDIEGSPVRMVKIGTHVYRVVVQKKQGRGTYTFRDRSARRTNSFDPGSLGRACRPNGSGSDPRADAGLDRPSERQGW